MEATAAFPWRTDIAAEPSARRGRGRAGFACRSPEAGLVVRRKAACGRPGSGPASSPVRRPARGRKGACLRRDKLRPVSRLDHRSGNWRIALDDDRTPIAPLHRWPCRGAPPCQKQQSRGGRRDGTGTRDVVATVRRGTAARLVQCARRHGAIRGCDNGSVAPDGGVRDAPISALPQRERRKKNQGAKELAHSHRRPEWWLPRGVRRMSQRLYAFLRNAKGKKNRARGRGQLIHVKGSGGPDAGQIQLPRITCKSMPGSGCLRWHAAARGDAVVRQILHPWRACAPWLPCASSPAAASGMITSETARWPTCSPCHRRSVAALGGSGRGNV